MARSEALVRGVRLLPILVDGTDMPPPHTLPDRVSQLADQVALLLAHHNVRTSYDALRTIVRRLVDEKAGG